MAKNARFAQKTNRKTSNCPVFGYPQSRSSCLLRSHVKPTRRRPRLAEESYGFNVSQSIHPATCKRSPTTTIALVAIIALGVAVLYSVRLANRAAVSGFQLFTQSLSGGGDLIISTPSGKIPTTTLPQLRRTLGTLPVVMLPVVEATAALPEQGSIVMILTPNKSP